MQVIPASIPGLVLIEPEVHSDRRGSFMEVWQSSRYQVHGLPASFVQCNVSSSRRGVLRGLHLQTAHPQAKLVSVLHGSAFDVAVDVRRGSPTFGKWYGATLTAETGRQLFVPEGCAHGLLALSEPTIVVYLVNSGYDPDGELVIRWDDPELGIVWPEPPVTLSSRDGNAPLLGAVTDRLPVFTR